MLNAFFVMYRESFEAILIVGILYSFIIRQPQASKAMKYLWLGVFAGLGLSALLAWGINTAQNEFQGAALEYFNNFIIFIAILLMTHMCIWMRKHARSLKKELQNDAEKSIAASHYWGIALLACISVGREGSETVIFLYGMAVESIEKSLMQPFFSAIALGLLASYITWIVFNRGMKFFKQHVFFKVTTIILFVTASSLTLMLTRNLIQADILPAIKDNIWDTSFILSEGSFVGRIFSGITGYQSSPALLTVLVYIAYWSITAYFYWRPQATQEVKHARTT